jgi:putative SOS response-associated peptidase YedK
MLLPYLTLASTVAAIENSYQLEFLYSYTPAFRFVPQMKLPVITAAADNKIILMTWGFNPVSDKNPEIPWVRSEGIIKKSGIKILIRTSRCLVLTNCFYALKNGSLILFFNPKEKVITLAGVWRSVKKDDVPAENSFVLITRESPVRLNKYTDRVPVIISRPFVRRYLNPKQPLMDITRVLNEVKYPEINGYPVDKIILKKKEWSKEDILPRGERIFSEQKFPEKVISHNWYYFS